MTTTKTHAFDWHQENVTNTFLAWAVLTMMPGHTKDSDKELFEELSEATDGFKSCELGITLNGVEVDAGKFIKRLDEAVDHAVEREAKKLVLEKVPGLDAFQETVQDLERAVRETIIRAASEAGLDISDDEWRDRY